MRLRFGALVGLGLAGLVAGCMPEPPTDVTVRTYKVSGTSLNSLERSLATHGPSVPGLSGRAFAAVETAFLHSFEPAQTGGTCRYNRNGRVGLRSEVILPEWRQRDSAPPSLQQKWDVVSQYAVIHEAGHIKISQKYARILEQSYKRLSAPDCEKLEASTLREVERILSQHSSEQQRFDDTDGPRFERYLRSLGYSTGA